MTLGLQRWITSSEYRQTARSGPPWIFGALLVAVEAERIDERLGDRQLRDATARACRAGIIRAVMRAFRLGLGVAQPLLERRAARATASTYARHASSMSTP